MDNAKSKTITMLTENGICGFCGKTAIIVHIKINERTETPIDKHHTVVFSHLINVNICADCIRKGGDDKW